jgi:hypothetical protein
VSRAATQGYSRAPAREGAPSVSAARAVSLGEGDCSICESGFRFGDEVLAHEDGRIAHFEEAKHVEGWA